MNYKVSQGSFWTTDVPALTLSECFKHRAKDGDIEAGRVKYFVVFANGKITQDILMRYVSGTFGTGFVKNDKFYANNADIIVFSKGVTPDAQNRLEHFKKCFSDVNIIFKEEI